MALEDPTTAIAFHPLDLSRLSIEFYGGKILEGLEPGLSHVVVHTSDKERLEELKRLRRQRREKFHIVSEEWVDECMKRVDLVEERNYQP